MKKLLIIIAVLAMCAAQASAGVLDASHPSLQLWLKGDAGITTDGGSGVTVWADQATGVTQGGANDATSFYATHGQLVNSTALNGQQAVRLNGVDNGFSVAGGTLDMWNSSGDFTVFAVIAIDAFSEVVNTLQDILVDQNVWSVNMDGAGIFMDDGTWSNVWSAPGEITAGAGITYSIRHAADGTTELRVNGNVIATGSVIDLISDPTYYNLGMQTWYGEARWFNGDMAEVMLYHELLSASDDAAVEGYLQDKYAIVPEPATIAMLGFGALALIRRKRQLR